MDTITKRALHKKAQAYFRALGIAPYDRTAYTRAAFGRNFTRLTRLQLQELCARLHGELCRRKRLEMAVYAAARRALDKGKLPEAELLRHARKYRFVRPDTQRLHELTEEELKTLKKDFNALWRQQKNSYVLL